MSDENPENRENRTNSRDNKPSDANRELNEFRPFRYFQRRIRLTQRKDAKNDERKRYRDTQESAVAEMLHYADATWRWVWSRGPAAWTAVFTGVLTFATIAAWWAMHFQNRIMLGQMNQTEQTLEQMRLDQRPWVWSCGVDVVPTVVAGEQLYFELPVQNYGRSPARVIFTQVGVLCALEEMTSPEHIKELFGHIFDSLHHGSMISHYFIPPGGKLLIIPPKQPVFTEQNITDIESGKGLLFVAFMVTYADNSGVVHHSNFTLVYSPKTKTLVENTIMNEMD